MFAFFAHLMFHLTDPMLHLFHHITFVRFPGF